jgi:hypothetical protein
MFLGNGRGVLWIVTYNQYHPIYDSCVIFIRSVTMDSDTKHLLAFLLGQVRDLI